MKKITIALMCILLSAGAAMAQKKFTLGPKIGVDYTHFVGNELEYGGMFNYQAGVFFEYRFNDKFSIAPEVVFAAQGGKEKYFSTKYNSDYTDVFRLNYINVPIIFKYYATPALSIDFGPQVGINVYSESTITYTLDGKDVKDVYHEKVITKAADLGVGLGLTYNITDDVFVQGRYTLGITKALDYNLRNGNAQIAIGYRF